MQRLVNVAQFVCVTGELAPTRAYATDSGLDVRGYLTEAVTLAPGEQQTVSTGCFSLLPIVPGWLRWLTKKVLGAELTIELQIRPKSGLALQGLSIVNTPSTVDNSYIGEVKVLLINHGQAPIVIQPNQKIAQVVYAPVLLYEPINAVFFGETTEHISKTLKRNVADTERGVKGFGHSGV